MTTTGRATFPELAEGRTDAPDPGPGRTGRWLVVTLYVNALLWSIPLQRSWSEALLRADAGRWWLGGLGVVFGVAVIAGALVLGRASRGAAPGRAAAPVAAAFAYVALVWYLSPVPDEVVHLAEYGALGLLLWWALRPEARRSAAWMAVAAAGGVGLVDEWVQHATPGRVFDWRDVVANIASALLPVWLLSGVLVRRRER